MDVLYFILLLLAAICFIVAALVHEVHPRINLIAFGLFFWVLVPLIHAAKALD